MRRKKKSMPSFVIRELRKLDAVAQNLCALKNDYALFRKVHADTFRRNVLLLRKIFRAQAKQHEIQRALSTCAVPGVPLLDEQESE